MFPDSQGALNGAELFVVEGVVVNETAVRMNRQRVNGQAAAQLLPDRFGIIHAVVRPGVEAADDDRCPRMLAANGGGGGTKNGSEVVGREADSRLV